MNKYSNLRKNKRKICILYDKGLSAQTIADLFSCSVTPIRDILMKEGVLKEHKRYDLHDDKDNIITLYKDGLSMAKIAKIYSVNAESIRRILLRYKPGIIRNSTAPKHDAWQHELEISNSYLRGASTYDLMEEYGASSGVINAILLKNGVVRGYKKEDIYDSKDKIIDMYIEGAGLKDLSKKFDCSEEIIKKVIMKFKPTALRKAGRKGD